MRKELKTITKPFDVVLTFDEITKLNEMVEQYKKGDYGFVPAMHIVFKPDKEFPEYMEVSACSIHDITNEINNAKEENRKFRNPHIDITDTMKAEMI